MNRLIKHLDFHCGQAAGGTGSRARPWNTLAAADAFHFLPGDQLLLKRGTTCHGELHPQGSGDSHGKVRETATLPSRWLITEPGRFR